MKRSIKRLVRAIKGEPEIAALVVFLVFLYFYVFLPIARIKSGM
jgi:hypothetical protein